MADVMASSKSLLGLHKDEDEDEEKDGSRRSTNGHFRDLGSSTSKILHKTIDYEVLPDSDYKVRYLEKETKKKSLIRKERSEDEDEDDNVGGIDLGLKLSPPNGHYLPKGSQSKSKSTSSLSLSSSSQEPNCASKYMYERDSGSVASEVELPSLVLMGCTNCLMYLMVPQVDAKCPKCKSSELLDIFRQNPSSAKRFRKY